MPVHDLLEHNLGLVDFTVPVDLDLDPPDGRCSSPLAERTGVDVGPAAVDDAGRLVIRGSSTPFTAPVDRAADRSTPTCGPTRCSSRQATRASRVRWLPERWRGPWLLSYRGPPCEPVRSVSPSRTRALR